MAAPGLHDTHAHAAIGEQLRIGAGLGVTSQNGSFQSCLVFTDLLKVRSGELLHAECAGAGLGGMSLPANHHIRGAAIIFGQDKALTFASRWYAWKPGVALAAFSENLIPLDDFTRRAGIPSPVLWVTVSGGRLLNGLSIPVALKKSGS